MFAEELDHAADLLAEILPRLEAVPVRRIPWPTEIDELRAIARRWNTSIRRRKFRDLPTLCEVCCTPIFRRSAHVTVSEWILPTVCGDRCRHARNAASSAFRRRRAKGRT